METAIALIMVFVPVFILLRKFTGTKLLIFQLSSGIPRFVVGFVSALAAYIILSQCSKVVLRRPCVYEVTAGFFVLPAVFLALLLIPVGFIQIVGAILKKMLGARAP